MSNTVLKSTVVQFPAETVFVNFSVKGLGQHFGKYSYLPGKELDEKIYTAFISV